MFSDLLVSPNPSRIIAMNRLRKIKLTMKRKLKKIMSAALDPQPLGFPPLA
jgi:hypothetical protein